MDMAFPEIRLSSGESGYVIIRPLTMRELNSEQDELGIVILKCGWHRLIEWKDCSLSEAFEAVKHFYRVKSELTLGS